MSGPGRSASAPTTRVLLICAALAAVQALLSLAVSPFTPAIAAASPPVYALVAAVHGVMPILARILTGVSGAATITAGVAGVLIWPFSPIGPLMVIALIAGGASFDVALLGARSPRWHRLVPAAFVAGAVLFVISLPVFSPEHLTPLILVATLLCRFAGELIAVLLSKMLALGLSRAGVPAQRDANT